MNWLAPAWAFVASNGATITALLAGSGLTGLWVLWRDRIRVSVRIIREPFDIAGDQLVTVTAVFEAENLGSRATSLRPDVKVICYGAESRKRRVMSLRID